jgi:hypothetical protein
MMMYLLICLLLFIYCLRCVNKWTKGDLRYFLLDPKMEEEDDLCLLITVIILGVGCVVPFVNVIIFMSFLIGPMWIPIGNNIAKGWKFCVDVVAPKVYLDLEDKEELP